MTDRARDPEGRFTREANAGMNAAIRAAALRTVVARADTSEDAPAIAGLDGGASRGHSQNVPLDANSGMNFLIRRQAGRYVGSLGTYSNGLARQEP